MRASVRFCEAGGRAAEHAVSTDQDETLTPQIAEAFLKVMANQVRPELITPCGDDARSRLRKSQRVSAGA